MELASEINPTEPSIKSILITASSYQKPSEDTVCQGLQ